MSNPGRKIHEGNAFNRDYILMTIPLFLMAVFFNGPRVLLLALVGVVTARITDRFAGLLRSRKYDHSENSSIPMALILVLMMPVTVRLRVVVMAVLVAILVGKEAFGGYQSYPFNPSAVGYCAAAVSWPAEVMTYPQPLNWVLKLPMSWENLWQLWSFKDAPLLEGPTATLKAGGLPRIDLWDLLLGNYPGPMGTVCSVVILSCVAYLVVRGRLSLWAPTMFLGVVVLIAFFFPRYTEIGWATFPLDWEVRLQVVKFEVFSGSTIFCAVFMVGEPGTLPKNRVSQIIYGLLLGVAGMMFRYYGNYASGICFAFLLVNAISGYFDRAVASFSARRKGKGAALT